jgi:hypothetical protein
MTSEIYDEFTNDAIRKLRKREYNVELKLRSKDNLTKPTLRSLTSWVQSNDVNPRSKPFAAQPYCAKTAKKMTQLHRRSKFTRVRRPLIHGQSGRDRSRQCISRVQARQPQRRRKAMQPRLRRRARKPRYTSLPHALIVHRCETI